MNWFDSWALTLTVLIPAVGAVVLMLIPRAEEELIKWVALDRDTRHLRDHDRHRVALQVQQGHPAAVRRQQALDRRHQQPLPRGDRRHLAADAGAVGVHHVPVRHLLVEPLPRAAQPEGVPGADPDPRDRDERHVHRPGPDPLLRVLRDRAAADVLHDRRLGRPQPRVRVDQVLPVHAVRLGADAAELPGPLLQGRRLSARAGHPAQLRHGRAVARGTAPASCAAPRT